MTAPTVAEIVTFRLKEGRDPAEFARAAEAMTPFLRSTGAMISRTLSADADGLWTEFITWTSEAAAKSAAEAMFARSEAGPFMEMIDQSDMSMRHAAISLYLPPEDHAPH
ncbi:hypothetical protein [Roseobacter sp. A03A-229]